MRNLIIVSLVLGSFSAFAVPSVDSTLNACVKKVVSTVTYSEKATETIRSIREGISECNESVREMKEQERAKKKAAANAKKIERLKKQLSKLQA